MIRRIKLVPTILAVLGLLLTLMVGAVGWRFLSIRSAQQAYQIHIDALVAKGQVVDEAGVKRLHTDSSKPELADEWRAIFAEFAKPEFQEASIQLPYLGSEGLAPVSVPLRGEEWEGEAEARKFLVDWNQLRDQLRKLAVKSRAVYFPMETSGEEFGNSEAHLPIRTAVKLLVLDGHMALRYNALNVALDDVRALLALSGLLQGEPSVMALLIDQSAQMAALEIVQTAVEQGVFNEVQLRELSSLLDAQKIPQEHLRLAISGERAQLLTFLDTMSNKQGSARYLLGSPRGRIAALDLLARLQAVTFDDLNSVMQAIDAIHTESDRYPARMGMVTSADHVAPFQVIGTIASASSLVGHQMHARIAKLAVAIQLYRLKHERLPEKLEDVAQVGFDLEQLMPVGGKPFGYRLSEDKSTAELWGFSIVARDLRTPDEPPEVVNDDRRWVWKL